MKINWKVSGAVVVLVPLVVLGVLFLRGYMHNDADRRLNEEDPALVPTAIAELKPWAFVGDKQAAFLLGSIYAYGWGAPDVPKDDEAAIYWFRRAAFMVTDETDAAAPAELGVAEDYAAGSNVQKADQAESLKWLRLAAAGGSKKAAELLAKTPAPAATSP